MRPRQIRGWHLLTFCFGLGYAALGFVEGVRGHSILMLWNAFLAGFWFHIEWSYRHGVTAFPVLAHRR